MALYQEYTFSYIATFLSDLAAFAAANGWTVTTDTSTETVLNKEGAAFRVVKYDTTSLRLYATQSGGTESTSVVGIDYLTTGIKYRFINCGSTIYIGRQVTVGGNWNWGGLINIVDKIGVWNGGAMIAGNYSSYYQFFSIIAYQRTTMWYEGMWSPIINAEGGIMGPLDNMNDIAVGAQPCIHNAAILPVPVPVFRLIAGTALYQPIGFAPGLYVFYGGNIYTDTEIITIGADQYIGMPYQSTALGAASNTKDLLLKLSA